MFKIINKYRYCKLPPGKSIIFTQPGPTTTTVDKLSTKPATTSDKLPTKSTTYDKCTTKSIY